MTSRLGALVLSLAACAGRGGPVAADVPAAREAAAAPLVDRVAMAERVRDETRRSWAAYVRDAWGHDELRPVTHTARDWYGAPLLITPVDALDTLVVMGLADEANAARTLIDERLSFDQDITVKNIEITIRVLGGLLSGYQLTGDAQLLRLADDLGARLLPVFGSPTGMPYVYVNLKTGKVSGAKSNPPRSGR